MKNTTKILLLLSFIILIVFVVFLALWTLFTLAVSVAGGFGEEDIKISLASLIFVNVLNFGSLCVGVVLVVKMCRGLFFNSGVNKKQLLRSFYLFIVSLTLVIGNYTLLQNGISIFG